MNSGSGNWGCIGASDCGLYGAYGANNLTYGFIGLSYCGVYGEHYASGNLGYLGSAGSGVYGGSGNGLGVYGYSYANTAVDGFNGANGCEGMLGSNSNGVYGYSGVAGGAGVYGSSSTDYGVYAFSSGGTALYAYSAATGGIGLSARADTAVKCVGAFYQSGGKFEAHPTSTTWSGTKPATVKLSNGNQVKLFTEESAEVYFTDYGEGMLSGGKAHIDLDAVFLQTVTVDVHHPMRVFVQLEGDCKGVYVANKTTTGFDVAELQNGNSNAVFTYRVVCKRRYYEDERLASEEQDIRFNTRMLESQWPEVVSRNASMAKPLEKPSVVRTAQVHLPPAKAMPSSPAGRVQDK